MRFGNTGSAPFAARMNGRRGVGTLADATFEDNGFYANGDGTYTDLWDGTNYDANGNVIYTLTGGGTDGAGSTISNWLTSGAQGIGTLASSLVNIGLTAAQIANVLNQAGQTPGLSAQQLAALQQERDYLLAQQNSQKSNTGLILLLAAGAVLFLVMRDKKS